ncbi:MAG TPA: glycerol-3-phosphate dehydrogenase/oxidase [Candidatus Limnocylindrales bacterium]|nr:glycerol-3-phosphate dehydrogenase/oxidase [Candidatus Limnocylindrales bacterium]
MHDILVIGGGIHGAAVARDASHRGLDVLLVEKGDLASATSSRTSKLIHGGLRYLETGQLRLVREALRERAILMRTAPEFVRPLPFLMPHLAGRGRPRRWVELGLWLYRFLAGSAAAAAPGASERRAVGAEEALRLAPGLDREGLRGASLFADAQMDDAPLCVAIALDAERAGAAIRTHTEVVALARTVDGRAWRAHFRDRIAGVDGEAEARVIVNTAGPWVDEVRGLAFGHPAPSVRRTRGTHIVLPVVASGCALLLTARRDGRVYFIVPWGSHTLVGTTDDDDPADPAAAEPRPEDVRYLLEESVGALPGSFTGARPVRAFAGIRPLARGHAERAWENSREHRVLAEGGMWSVVGGKYTTHRALAERVVDQVVRALGRAAGACVTATLPLQSRRAESLEKLRADFPRRTELTGGFAITEAEVAHAARVEKARCLDDILLRRTRLWLDARALREAALPCAMWAAPVLGWSERTRAAEVERLHAILDREDRAIEAAVDPSTAAPAGQRGRA